MTYALQIKLSTSTSFRAIGFIIQWGIRIIGTSDYAMAYGAKQISYGTVINWVKKIGYYELHRPLEKSGDWVYLIDESVEFGNNKLLLIYGIQLHRLPIGRAVQLKDMQALHIEGARSWKGVDIAERIELATERTGQPLYVLSDKGPAIVKSIKIKELLHVPDVTHALAKIFEKFYAEDNHFITLCKKMNRMRKAYCLSDIAFALPPKQRAKARFQNIGLIGDWGLLMLNYLDNLPIIELQCGDSEEEKQAKTIQKNLQEKVQKKFQWVSFFKDLLEEIDLLVTLKNELSYCLKTEHLSHRSIAMAEEIMACYPSTNDRVISFKKQVISYCKGIALNLDLNEEKFCCTDIIESAFGKYKGYLSSNSAVGITDLALCTGAFCVDLEEQYIKKAMEFVTLKELKEWTEKHFLETVIAQRRNNFQSKNSKKKFKQAA